MKKKSLLFILCLYVALSSAQTSQVFLLFQSGSYMNKVSTKPELVINLGAGYEHILADKLSISFAYRRLFYLPGIHDIPNKYFTAGNFFGSEKDTYTGDAIDYEAKYFFDKPDEGGYYMSSCFSFQMMKAHVEILDVSDQYGTGGISPVNVETFDQTFNLFPLTFKIGRRYSGDNTNFDLFIGYSINLGAGADYHLKYAEYIPYDKPSKNTFIFGFTTGVRF